MVFVAALMVSVKLVLGFGDATDVIVQAGTPPNFEKNAYVPARINHIPTSLTILSWFILDETILSPTKTARMDRGYTAHALVQAMYLRGDITASKVADRTAAYMWPKKY